jgi:hypothetical protein
MTLPISPHIPKNRSDDHPHKSVTYVSVHLLPMSPVHTVQALLFERPASFVCCQGLPSPSLFSLAKLAKNATNSQIF